MTFHASEIRKSLGSENEEQTFQVAGLNQASESTEKKVAKHAKAGAKQRRPRYVFAASTGHAGSTSLSSIYSYTGVPRGVGFTFERALFPRDADVATIKSINPGNVPWVNWWNSMPSQEAQLRRVQDYKRRIDEEMATHNFSTYVDLGHHILEGILPLIPEVFGDDAVVIRVRRARASIAESLIESRPSICQYLFGSCPHKRAIKLTPGGVPWSAELFDGLSLADKETFFWFVDEVEAEWQSLIQEHPGMPRAECSWTDSLQPCFETVAQVLGVGVKDEGAHLKNHTTSEADETLLHSLSAMDLSYQAKMKYTPAQQALIRAAQF